MNTQETLPPDNATTATEAAQEAVSGRAVFAVDMSPVGLVVRTAFLTQQQQLLEMPAVFPNLQYALAQIDELRQIVIDRFSQAASVGIQVLASQAASRGTVPGSLAEETSKPLAESGAEGNS